MKFFSNLFQAFLNLLRRKNTLLPVPGQRGAVSSIATALGFSPLKIGRIIRVTPGQRHAWFESNLGPTRKPIIKGSYFSYHEKDAAAV